MIVMLLHAMIARHPCCMLIHLATSIMAANLRAMLARVSFCCRQHTQESQDVDEDRLDLLIPACWLLCTSLAIADE